MNDLYIMCGIPGCGKSTWASSFMPKATVVSSDAIRLDICKDENDQSRNAEVFATFHELIRSSLKYGPVVADATHLHSQSRAETRRDARGHRAHLVFFTNVTQAILRNATRDRKVPEGVMYRMLDNYERTKLSVPDEPFDSIITISDFRGSA